MLGREGVATLNRTPRECCEGRGGLNVRATILLAVLMPLWSTVLWGQTTQSSPRTPLQKDYLQTLQDNPSPFGSAPVTHITVQRMAFTTGISSEIYNATIVPESADISKSRLGQKVRMDVGGWDSSALVAFSSANLGLGILGRGGQRQVSYQDSGATSTSSSAWTGYFGSASFAGPGLLGYYLISAGMLPSNVRLTFMLGASQLAVQHKTNEWIDGGGLSTYTYPVNFTHGGIDINLELNRLFSVYFWYNYITAKAGNVKLKSQADGWRVINASAPTIGDSLAPDQELFWQSAPRQRLGIDLIATLSGLDVHLGGLLGLIGNLGTQPKYIYDNSVSLAVSYTFRG